MIRVGFDIGGVLTKYPEIFLPMMRAYEASPDFEVHIITDMPKDAALAMLRANGVTIAEERVWSADYTAYGEGCKAILAETLGLDVLYDDFIGYVSLAGAPKVRLLVMPDATRPYYADTWKTDGVEPAFGRARWTP